jgi:hypothetical protein
MAKAGGKTTTARIRLGEAKRLSGECLGNVKYAEREIRKRLEAGEIPWWCVRFAAPDGYSGLGPGDPNFWREPDDLITSARGILIAQLEWLGIEGDSAEHINGAAAYGIELDRGALVRLGLLPPDDIDSDSDETVSLRQREVPKRLIEKEVERRAATGERYDSITELSLSLHKWMKTVGAKPLKPRTIENYVRGDLWRLVSKK